ncbi:MAG TPA: transglycosylase domain-containing protein [Telluria sp.]|nr:transglycosylase domain-containing protein [Telluria sp.]
MDQDRKPLQRVREAAARLFARAAVFTRAHTARAREYLMARPAWKRVLLVGLWGGGALLALLVVYILILIPLTPGIKDLKQARTAKASAILSADGNQLATFEEGLHERVKLDQISPFVLQALIATEDHRFYDHSGIDFRRTLSSVGHTLGGDPQGGSTITQQLARNMFPEEIGRSRSINRKLKEMITAVKIESTYSKTEILETYLNTVPFLYNTFGIETAARTYFDKPAVKLDILEAATLVGMLKGTSYYNPVSRPERSVERRNVVLGQMLKHGIIDQKRFDSLKKKPLRLHFTRQSERTASDSHFTAYVRKWLIQWADQNDYNLQLDGLVVHTTLDYTLQTAAMRAVDRQGAALQIVADVEWAQADSGSSSSIGSYAGMHGSVTPFEYFWRTKGGLVNAFIRETPEYKAAIEGGENAAAALKRLRADRDFMAQLRRTKTRLETGFVAIDPASGEVRAWVGSRDFQKDQFDHVSQASRQPGSTFKPFVYGAALEKGISPERTYTDEVMAIKAGDGTMWRPTDMTGASGNQMTLREGLIMSKNTITAQVMQDVGLPSIVKLARDLGIRDSKLDPVPSLALGTSPVTLLEMVSAYSTIAAQGEYRKPVFIKRITDRQGNTIAEFGKEPPERAMTGDAAVTLIDIMRGVINRGTGTAIRYRFGIGGDVAGKTGTTQNNTDGWFIMMHPNLVAGAWVGFNDNRVTMRSNYWGQGGHNAILVVGDFFKAALDSGKVSSTAAFPGAPRQAPAPAQEEPEDVIEQGGDMHQEGVPVPEAPPEEVIEEDGESAAPAPEPELQPLPPPRPERGERADPVQN